MQFFQDNSWLADWLAVALTILIPVVAWLVRKSIKDTRIKDQLEQEIETLKKRVVKLTTDRGTLISRVENETGSGVIEKLKTLEENGDESAIEQLAESYFKSQSHAIADTARVLGQQALLQSAEDGLPALEEAKRFIHVGMAARPGRRDLIDLAAAVNEQAEILEGGNPELSELLKDQDIPGLIRATSTLYNQGRFPLSLSLAERLIQKVRSSLGPRNLQMAQAMEMYANSLAQVQGHSEAIEPSTKALDIARGFLGAHDRRLVRSIINHATTLVYANQFVEGRKTAEEAIYLIETHDLPAQNDLAIAWRLLGVLGRKTNDPQASLRAFRKALRVLRRQDDPDKVIMANVLNSIAVLYSAQKKPRRAEILNRRALNIQLENFGPDHVRTAFIKLNLASVLHDLHRPEETLELLESAIPILERDHGSDHEYTTTAHAVRKRAQSDLEQMAQSESVSDASAQD